MCSPLWSQGRFSQLYTHLKTCKIEHFKYVQFTTSQLSLNEALFKKIYNQIKKIYLTNGKPASCGLSIFLLHLDKELKDLDKIGSTA